MVIPETSIIIVGYIMGLWRAADDCSGCFGVEYRPTAYLCAVRLQMAIKLTQVESDAGLVGLSSN